VTDVVLRQRSDHMGTKYGLRSGLKMRTVRIATCNLCTGLRELCDGASCTHSCWCKTCGEKVRFAGTPSMMGNCNWASDLQTLECSICIRPFRTARGSSLLKCGWYLQFNLTRNVVIDAHGIVKAVSVSSHEVHHAAQNTPAPTPLLLCMAMHNIEDWGLAVATALFHGA